MSERPIVVVRRGGRIEAVQGGAPESWIGRDVVDIIRGGDEHERFIEWLHDGNATIAEFRGKANGMVAVVLVEGVPVRRVPFAPRELIRRAIDTFVEQARNERVSLRVVLDEDLPAEVELDPDKLSWVLTILIGNALRVLKRPRDEAEGTIAIGASFDAESQELVITVRDDGPGMTPETARRLFDPDPNTGRTTGLALVLARDVLAAHRGSLAVWSEVGRGAEFTVRIPA